MPTGLVSAGHGKVRLGNKDEAWALHREHVHKGGFARLFGPDPREIYVPPSAKEVKEALQREFDFIVKHHQAQPAYAVLNLCRLLYTRATGEVAVSKHQSAIWALATLPATWRPVVRAAGRVYRGKQSPRGWRLLRRYVAHFLDFAEHQLA